MSEVLDGGLELIIAVEVCWPSYWVNSLAELGFKAVDNKADFEASVAGEDAVAVDFLKFERPAGDEDDSLVEV